MTPTQVAMIVGCSSSTIKKLIQDKVIQATKVHLSDKMYFWDIPESQIQVAIDSESNRGRPRGV